MLCITLFHSLFVSDVDPSRNFESLTTRLKDRRLDPPIPTLVYITVEKLNCRRHAKFDPIGSGRNHGNFISVRPPSAHKKNRDVISKWLQRV